MYLVKPHKKIGAFDWAVFKGGVPVHTGLTRRQAVKIKEQLEKKEKQNVNVSIPS